MQPDTQNGNHRSPKDILVAATIEAVVCSLLEEIDKGASVNDLRGLMHLLLRQAQGNRTH